MTPETAIQAPPIPKRVKPSPNAEERGEGGNANVKAGVVAASGIPVHCAHDRLADVTSLIPNPRNPAKHPDKQIALLAKIIKAQGWRNPIVVSRRSGFVVKGHGRLQAAALLQVEQVPVDDQDYPNEAAEWADMLADNRIAELAETDNQVLTDVLLELDTGAIDMDLTGFDSEALEFVMGAEHQESVGNGNLSDRFMIPPFSVLNAREGWWQDRKRAWIALGIQSELGRGGDEESASFKNQGAQSAFQNSPRRQPQAAAPGQRATIATASGEMEGGGK